MSLTLHIVVCSTRPGRVGLPVAQWFHETASKHDTFDAKLVDLAEINLPIYDESDGIEAGFGIVHPAFKRDDIRGIGAVGIDPRLAFCRQFR